MRYKDHRRSRGPYRSTTKFLWIFCLSVCSLLVPLVLWHKGKSSTLDGERRSRDEVASSSLAINGIWTKERVGWERSIYPSSASKVDIYFAHRSFLYSGQIVSENVTVIMMWRSSECVDYNRDYPSDFLSTLSSMRKYDVSIDIGACYGDTSVPMALRSHEVLAFEPNPKSFEVLKANAVANPSLRITPHQYAVGHDGEVMLWYGGDHFCNGGGWGSWKNPSEEQRIRAKSVDLYKFLLSNYPDKINRIGYIKIDAEGFDGEILRSLSPLIARVKPIIVVEWFAYFRDETAPLKCTNGSLALFQAISDLGYKAWKESAPWIPVPGCESAHWVPDLWLSP